MLLWARACLRRSEAASASRRQVSRAHDASGPLRRFRVLALAHPCGERRRHELVKTPSGTEAG
jgi:hypothetical protein